MKKGKINRRTKDGCKFLQDTSFAVSSKSNYLSKFHAQEEVQHVGYPNSNGITESMLELLESNAGGL